MNAQLPNLTMRLSTSYMDHTLLLMSKHCSFYGFQEPMHQSRRLWVEVQQTLSSCVEAFSSAQSDTMRDRASMSCLRLLLFRASPVKPPRSPVMPSMCCSVFVSVSTDSLSAFTLSGVNTCRCSSYVSQNCYLAILCRLTFLYPFHLQQLFRSLCLLVTSTRWHLCNSGQSRKGNCNIPHLSSQWQKQNTPKYLMKASRSLAGWLLGEDHLQCK